MNYSKSGFTILEVVIAMFIFAVLLLGLLAGYLKTYQIQTLNEMRNEAIKIAQEEIEKYRIQDFDSIPNTNIECSFGNSITRQIRKTYINFTIGRRITEDIPDSVKRIEVTVCWNFKGKQYSYTVSSLITKF